MNTVLLYLGATILSICYLMIATQAIRKDSLKGLWSLVPPITWLYTQENNLKNKRLVFISLFSLLLFSCGLALSFTKRLEQQQITHLTRPSMADFSELISDSLSSFKLNFLPNSSSQPIHAFWQDHSLYLVRDLPRQPPQTIRISLPVGDLDGLELNILPTDEAPSTTVHVSQAASKGRQPINQTFTEGYTLGLKLRVATDQSYQGKLYLGLPGQLGEFSGDLFIASSFRH